MTGPTVFKALPVSLCLVLWLGCTPAAEGDVESALSGIGADAVRAHVKFLADDLLEGRGTATRGHDLAALYVAAQFEAMGLEPGGVDGTFFQPIRFRTAAIVPARSSVTLVRDGTEGRLTWGADYYMTGALRDAESSVEGPVVFVGQGVTAPNVGVDDYRGVDARGKIVAFLRGSPEVLPSEERAHHGRTRTKLDNAAAHGAIGAIQLWSEGSNFVGGVRRAARPSMTWLDPTGLPLGRETDIHVLAVLSEEGTSKLLGGSSLPAEAKELPVSVSVLTTSTHDEVTSPNVVALARGSDPNLRDEYVVYSAHLDHLGIGAPVDGDSIYNGVTDNAGSIGMMVEVARAFTRLDTPQRRSVLFVAVTGEERGLLGSDYFVANPTVPRPQIVANLNMDGSNLLFDFLNIVDIGGEHSTLGAVFRSAASRLGLEAVADPTPEQNYFVRSDHYSFVRRGIPALFPMTGTKAVDPSIDGIEVQAERRRDRYHLPSDDLTRALDFKAGEKTARFFFLMGHITAQDDERPRWNEGDFFGDTFGGIR